MDKGDFRLEILVILLPAEVTNPRTQDLKDLN